MRLWYVVAYDIADRRRLCRVHRVLRSRALAVQRSVFLFRGSVRELCHVMRMLERVVDVKTDDVRAYPVHVPQEAQTLALSTGRGENGPEEAFALLPVDRLTVGLPRISRRRRRGKV